MLVGRVLLAGACTWPFLVLGLQVLTVGITCVFHMAFILHIYLIHRPLYQVIVQNESHSR